MAMSFSICLESGPNIRTWTESDSRPAPHWGHCSLTSAPAKGWSSLSNTSVTGWLLLNDYIPLTRVFKDYPWISLCASLNIAQGPTLPVRLNLGQTLFIQGCKWKIITRVLCNCDIIHASFTGLMRLSEVYGQKWWHSMRDGGKLHLCLCQQKTASGTEMFHSGCSVM